MNNMGHSYGKEVLLTGISPTPCSMNHHGYEYYYQIIDWIIWYPIVMLTYHSIVPDYLAIAMQISSKILGCVDTIICGVDLKFHSWTHGLPLKLDLGHDGLFHCEWYLTMNTDLTISCSIEDSAYLEELRCDFGSSVPQNSPYKPWLVMVIKYDIPRFQLIPF